MGVQWQGRTLVVERDVRCLSVNAIGMVSARGAFSGKSSTQLLCLQSDRPGLRVGIHSESIEGSNP